MTLSDFITFVSNLARTSHTVIHLTRPPFHSVTLLVPQHRAFLTCPKYTSARPTTSFWHLSCKHSSRFQLASQATHNSWSSTNNEAMMDEPTHNPAAATDTGSRLLDLPAEIRNNICALALAEHRYIVIAVNGLSPRAPLTRVNRQLRSETAQAYYSINTFRAAVTPEKTTGPLRWANGTSAACLQAIRSLTLFFEPGEDFEDRLHDAWRKGWPYLMKREGLQFVLACAPKVVDRIVDMIDKLAEAGVVMSAIRFEDALEGGSEDVKAKEELMTRMGREVREGVEKRVNAQAKYDGLQIVRKMAADEQGSRDE